MSRAGVAGLVMDGDSALPVLSVLGSDGDRLLVLEVGGRRFGLLVEEVSGVAAVDEERLTPPPEGQATPLITGVLDSDQEVALVIDVGVLAKQVLD
jgi:chemotaxis signal transduction protein